MNTLHKKLTNQRFKEFMRTDDFDREEDINEILAIGSGFNCDFEVIKNCSNIEIASFYQVVNDNGFYDGYIDFTIILNNKKEMQLIVKEESKKLAEKYDLFSYIYETMYYILYDNYLTQ